MIIYGTRAVHLTSSQSSNTTCPKCATKDSLIFSVFSKHAHIFWIPLFPIGKTGFAQCKYCNHEMEKKEMPDHVRKAFLVAKGDTNVPIWQFSGLILIAGLAVFGYFQGKEYKKEELTRINAPKVEDVYKYKTEGGNYSTMKISSITEDSVFVRFNDYETNKKSGVKEINILANYSELNYGMSKEDVKKQYAEGKIYDVIR